MNSLLGNYLSLGDLIVVHMCGQSKDVNLIKTQEYLGLTITDNGQGRAFVKKVKSNDSSIEKVVKPGDHIAAINSESTIGFRHYEVAKALRGVPHETNFTLHLIEPLYSEKYLNGEIETDLGKRLANDLNTDDRTSIQLMRSQESNPSHQLTTNTPNATLVHYSNPDGGLNSVYDDLINSSLPIDRLLSSGNKDNGSAIQESVEATHRDAYRHTIEKINSILEAFLGINDSTLAIQIYRLARDNKDSFSCFAKAIKTCELGAFNFGEDIETYLWNCATGCVA